MSQNATGFGDWLGGWWNAGNVKSGDGTPPPTNQQTTRGADTGWDPFVQTVGGGLALGLSDLIRGGLGNLADRISPQQQEQTERQQYDSARPDVPLFMRAVQSPVSWVIGGAVAVLGVVLLVKAVK